MREIRDAESVLSELNGLVRRYADSEIYYRGSLRRRIERCLCELDQISAEKSVELIDRLAAIAAMSPEERHKVFKESIVAMGKLAKEALEKLDDGQNPGAIL